MKKSGDHFFNISVYASILALVLGTVIFALLQGKFRTTESEVDIIILPKSEMTVLESDQIAENMTIIPTRLSFYEKLLADNAGINDQFGGLASEKRKAEWNKILKVERKGKSTIIEIKIQDKSQSPILASQAARTLFDVMSQYYNIKTEIDFRIIDGPITTSVIGSWPILALASLISGIILAFLINILYFSLSGLSRPRFAEKSEMVSLKMPQELPKINFADDNYFKTLEKEEPIRQDKIKKAPAPENLPIVPAELPVDEGTLKNIYSAEELKSDQIESRKPAEPKAKPEPTDEELKKRLNQLLKGDL